MRRFFAKNLFFVIAVNLLVKPLWIFLIDRTVQNKVGHASYGIYQALFNLGLVFQILLDFGINNYNSRTLSEFPGKIKTLFPAMLTARLLLSLGYLIIVCAIGFTVGYRGWEIMMLAGVLAIQALNSLLQFIRSNTSGLHRFKADGLLSVADRFLMILVCGFLLINPATAKNFRIEWFVAAQVFCYALAILLGFFILRKISKASIRFSFDRRRVSQIIRKSFPYATLIFLMSVYTRADMMLVERLSAVNGNEQAGIYAAAYRLLDVGNMFGLMFATMLLPVFGKMLSKRQSVQPIVQLCVNLLFPASLIVAVAAVFFRSEIMHLLYRHTQETDVTVFALLMVAFPAYSLSNVYSTLLTANGDLKLLNKIAFFGVLINLSLNFLLIPKYSSVGAAFTACITQTCLAICFMVFGRKKARLPRNARQSLSLVSFLLLLIFMGLLVKFLPVFWIAQMLVLSLCGLGLMFFFKYISLDAIKQLIKR